MLSLHPSQRYFFYDGMIDMRKGFDGLCGVVRDQFQRDPLSGDVFIFLSRSGSRVKFLHWQGDGFALYYKRLEKGTFEFPRTTSGSSMPISAQELMLIMEGISLASIKKRVRYSHQNVGNYSMQTRSKMQP
jgi:transposase